MVVGPGEIQNDRQLQNEAKLLALQASVKRVYTGSELMNINLRHV